MLTVAGDEIGGVAIDGRSLLDEIAREGARRMLVAALETEVAAYLHRPRYRARCRRPCLGRSQWPGPHAEGHAGRGHNRRQCAAINDRRVGTDGQRFKFTSRILRRTCGVRRRLPRCCPCSTCADSRRATSARPSPRS